MKSFQLKGIQEILSIKRNTNIVDHPGIFRFQIVLLYFLEFLTFFSPQGFFPDCLIAIRVRITGLPVYE